MGETNTTTDQEGSRSDEEDVHAGSKEAGIVRGVSRSVAQRAVVAQGRNLARLPQVGRLPRAAPRKVPMPRAAPRVPRPAVPRVPRPSAPRVPRPSAVPRTKVPVKRVARVTDRMSQGLDAYAAYEDGSSSSKRRQQLARIARFGVSLVKNTFLGAIVFETYCWIVAESEQQVWSNTTDDISTSTPIYKDVFETTPLPVHFIAGAAGGSLQGIGGMIWDSAAQSFHQRKLCLPTLSPLLRSAGQHAAAHSILFGSYETYKRLLLKQLQSTDPGEWDGPLKPHQRVEYFLDIAVAGGLAGQCQHVVSSLLEQLRRLPSLSSTLWAFPPSAIAFLAFEYGKDQVANWSSEDDDED